MATKYYCDVCGVEKTTQGWGFDQRKLGGLIVEITVLSLATPSGEIVQRPEVCASCILTAAVKGGPSA